MVDSIILVPVKPHNSNPCLAPLVTMAEAAHTPALSLWIHYAQLASAGGALLSFALTNDTDTQRICAELSVQMPLNSILASIQA